MSELINKQDNLFNRIMERLNGEVIVTNDEIASYSDVISAVEEGMGSYNSAILSREKEYLHWINKRNRKTRSFPKAVKIVSSVEKEYNRIDILFEDNKRITLLSNFPYYYKIAHTDFDVEKTNTFIMKDKAIYNYIFANLLSFKYFFPDFEYTFKNNKFSNENEYSEILDDGFISYTINMNDPKCRYPYFSDVNDNLVASIHSKKYGKLEDYLGQRSHEFLSKSSIERSKLNPLINAMLDSYINELDEGYSHIL